MALEEAFFCQVKVKEQKAHFTGICTKHFTNLILIHGLFKFAMKLSGYMKMTYRRRLF